MRRIAISTTLSAHDLQAALPTVSGTLDVPGLEAAVEVYRDAVGVPHIRARSLHDAFFAQGFVHAQDRLWQMEYDRRRALGRWAEYAGAPAVAADALYRRFGLEASARLDYAAFSPETRALFDTYAAGVNAFIGADQPLPIEFALVDDAPAPWEPWHSVAIYKVRHALMGVWGQKLWRARQLRAVGKELATTLRAGMDTPGPLIVPPGGEYDRLPDPGDDTPAGEAVAGLWEWGAGSNNWAVHGSRTASGKPLLAGDPHRALDVPNVYYQNHLACPEFDTIGYSFAGLPGFPHFAHNERVAWCITHASADYQDLYVEKFEPGNPARYEFQGAWLDAERRQETILVRGGAPVTIDVTVTRHGPIVVGAPEDGYALAIRYTATCEPNATFEALLPMLRARSVDELDAAMRPWVDPCNNFLMADVAGNIGYLMRGQLPVRGGANAWLPVPGWTGEHEWHGKVPFEELPRARNPATGYIATANNRIVGDEYPHYVSVDYAPPFRAQRVTERLEQLTAATVDDMAGIHADRVSIPAQAFIARLPAIEPLDERSRAAKRLLLAWDGVLDPESAGAALYAVWREETVALVLEGPVLAELLREPAGGPLVPFRDLPPTSRLRFPLLGLMARDDRSVLPSGTDWDTLLARALGRAVAWLEARLGPEMAAWTWGAIHHTVPKHTLSTTFPELAALLDPPRAGVGGDGDTPQAASYSGRGDARFGLTSTSVTRYVFDLADWDSSGWVVPLGASGHPGSPHYADQLPAWSEQRLLPMTYSWDKIVANADARLLLEPPRR